MSRDDEGRSRMEGRVEGGRREREEKGTMTWHGKRMMRKTTLQFFINALIHSFINNHKNTLSRTRLTLTNRLK